LDVAGKGRLQVPTGLVGLSLAGQLEDPMAVARRQQGAIHHGIVCPAELQEGVAEPIGVVQALQRRVEQVGPMVVPLADAEAALRRTAPGGVHGPVVRGVF
jgi:hypothetical protein